jgi:hypothetical protein
MPRGSGDRAPHPLSNVRRVYEDLAGTAAGWEAPNRLAGRTADRLTAAGRLPLRRGPFRYRDRGATAVIGRGRAVADLKDIRCSASNFRCHRKWLQRDDVRCGEESP